MDRNRLSVVGRPLASEYAPYYETYVGGIPETDILAVLRDQREATVALLENLPPEKIDFRYAPEKWTLRQVFGHVVDMEWVFTSRALHFARAVPGPLPGVEQDDVVKVVDFEARPWSDLVDQYGYLRLANIKLFEGFDEAAWARTGVASGNPVSVRALAYIIAGHERHHMAVLRERYL
jgi:hypothetical protein